MRNLLLALLLASPLSAQVTITGMTLEDVTITAAADTTPAEDWTDSFIAVYDFEASGDPWANDENATGGSSCNMSPNGTAPSRETGGGDYVEGTAAALVEDSVGENEYLSSTCDDLGIDLDNASVSWGAWVRVDSDASTELLGYNTSNTGIALRRSLTTDAPVCRVGGVSQTNHTGDTDSFEIDTWYHFTCVFDASGETIDDFVDGDSSAASATAHTDGSDVRNYRIGGPFNGNDTNVDEAFVYSGVLTEADTCRIASCNVDGSLCSCNGTAWVDDGRHTTLSLTCTLPTNCNDASP